MPAAPTTGRSGADGVAPLGYHEALKIVTADLDAQLRRGEEQARHVEPRSMVLDERGLALL
ncbi:hypothetical protein Q5424_01290 [Conexibacter sp. JD483]|uniref:hypothetical protein n=1 Tax=unclassified Conexibacter TaxID=2627773 RepID=UPI00272480CC|nr:MULTISPECIES: hypothetical protein [unclassified Conexibacter]MDO8185863.1 hypothetical protein [Conexibacter sp. CPCC 205706]MDO8198607.1 hypothetical protein [Conexibacter sp. CPCC 205762]MDR9367693.1 hypothetical protein [Conexibacter sp. JD483]